MIWFTWIMLVSLCVTIVVPLLINASYSLPFVVFQTKWGAVEVLNFYSSLLEVSIPVVMLWFTAYFTIAQIRHGQEFQQTLRMWEEIEKSIDVCLDDIHPYKLQYAFHSVISDSNKKNAFQLIGQIRAYSIAATISADKLSRSLTQINDEELSNLVKQIVSVRNDLLSMADQYQECYKQVMIAGLSNKKVPSLEAVAKDQEIFAQNVEKLDELVQGLYKEKYLDLFKKKSELFQKKYAEISQRRPKLMWENDD